jgi:predicted metalloprotease with PDZ domain
MRLLASVVFGVGACLGAINVAAAQSPPLIRILIAPGPMDEVVNNGEATVTMNVPAINAPAGSVLFRLPEMRDLSVTDEQGPVPGASGDKNGWSARRPVNGDLTIRYRVPVSNTAGNGGTTPVYPRIDGKGFSAIGMTFLPIPESKADYRIRIDWDLKRMSPNAAAVSSFGDGDAEAPAGPAARLRYVALMAGELHREPAVATPGALFSAAWSGDAGFDLHPPMTWANKLHAYMIDFFQTKHDPAYRVFLRFNPTNAGGGVAFPNSFFATYGAGVTAEGMKQILGHEMTHTFTANDLGKWYVEGDAVYYQVRLPWRARMMSTETYLKDINNTAARYYTNAEINAPEEKIIPNFFSNPWLNTLGYDRGALYFAILNGKINRASGGKRSVDDLVRIMVAKGRAGETITDATWTDLLRREIGEEGVSVHTSMMAGGLMIPESDDYGPCFRRFGTKIRRYELGFKPKTLPDGRKEITELLEGSEAAKAGLRDGDIVSYRTITTEGVKRDPTSTLDIQVTRDGKTFPITFLPRGAAFDAYQWERVPGVPDSACRPKVG